MKLPKLNIVIISEDNHWVAVGLEHFLAAQAKTPLAAVEELRRMWEAQPYLDQTYGQEPFSLIPKAPDEYWKMFQDAPVTLVWRGALHPLDGEFRMAS